MQSQSNNFRSELSKRLIKFSIDIITLCNELRENKNLRAIADQLIRSGTSIGANIIESKAASSTKDYIKYFEIALKSANETLYWLILAYEFAPDLKDRISTLRKETEELTRIIDTSIKTLKDQRLTVIHLAFDI